MSDSLPPDQEGLRFTIESEFAQLLIKRKERDEARKHIEKAIAFLQPLGISVGNAGRSGIARDVGHKVGLRTTCEQIFRAARGFGGGEID